MTEAELHGWVLFSNLLTTLFALHKPVTPLPHCISHITSLFSLPYPHFLCRAGFTGPACTELKPLSRANRDSPVGVEVGGAAYWSTQWIFTNIMAQSSSGWWTQRAADRYARVRGPLRVVGLHHGSLLCCLAFATGPGCHHWVVFHHAF